MNQTKPNISTSEIEKFNQLTSDWWDANGRMKSLHDINPLRLAYILKRTQLEGKRVLDVGCGGGLLTEQVALQGAKTIGIDASDQMTDIARAHAKQSNLDIQYITTDIEHLTQFTRPGFDVILCMELLEHVPSYESVIQACKKVLNPDGIIIFATINRNLLSFLLAIVSAEYILGLLPRGTHDYNSLIKPEELKQACFKAGLKNFDLTGFSYNPLTQKYYLCKNSLVNYLASFKQL
jgi:2-polyprenyl-6-hydroxyphenyl methylase/3-demethylubiquinone-9 3-methyltransferase